MADLRIHEGSPRTFTGIFGFEESVGYINLDARLYKAGGLLTGAKLLGSFDVDGNIFEGTNQHERYAIGVVADNGEVFHHPKGARKRHTVAYVSPEGGIYADRKRRHQVGYVKDHDDPLRSDTFLLRGAGAACLLFKITEATKADAAGKIGLLAGSASIALSQANKEAGGTTSQEASEDQAEGRSCPNCGSAVPADSRFCDSCGAKLAGLGETEPQESSRSTKASGFAATAASEIIAESKRNQKAKKQRKAKGGSGGCGCFWFLVFAFLAGSVLTQQGDKDETRAEDDLAMEQRYTHSRVNVRSCPETSCSVVQVLDRGFQLDVANLESGWWEWKTIFGTSGYVADAVLHESPP